MTIKSHIECNRCGAEDWSESAEGRYGTVNMLPGWGYATFEVFGPDYRSPMKDEAYDLCPPCAATVWQALEAVMASGKDPMTNGDLLAEADLETLP